MVYDEVGMKVILDDLPCMQAVAIIKWCHAQGIDKEKCTSIIEAMSVVPVPNIEWSLDIPEKYVSWLMLKLS